MIESFHSLLKPQKYAARRSLKDSQAISTITSDRDGSGGGRHGAGQNAGTGQQQALYDRDRHTQVKTYTDHGNGYSQRSGGNTTHYSKVGKLMYIWNLCIVEKSVFGVFFSGCIDDF